MDQLCCYKNKFDNDNTVIKNTCALLHDYYVEHHGWDMPIQNPSGLVIKTLNNKKSLTDNYDQHSIFFTVTNRNNDIVSCARLCTGDKEKCLEIEKYENAKNCLKSLLIKKEALNIIEMTREGINLNYLNDEQAYLLLLHEIFNFCLENKYSLLTTTNLPEWEKIYEIISFPQLQDMKFKYIDSEPNKVNVYFALNNQLKIINKRIETRLKARGIQ